jgi:hypothetical protein
LLDVHALEIRGDIDTTETIAEVLASWVRSGRLDEGLARLDPWLGREPHFAQWLRLIAPIAAEIARYFVRVGDFPRAVGFLEEAVRLGLRRSQILADPELQLMRGFRGFEELMSTWARGPEDDEPDEEPEN